MMAMNASSSPRVSLPSPSASASSVSSAMRSDGASGVDPKILKKLSASVSRLHGQKRTNLSYVVSVETLIPGRRAFQEERESCQLLTRSFDDFRRFRKSLLARVGSTFDASTLLPLSRHQKSAKCHCEGVGKGCSFDVTRTFLERLRFTRLPFLGLGGASEDALNKRQLEMNNFLRIVFAILHRMQPSSWQSDCLFLRDVMAFLEVQDEFIQQQIEDLLKHKNRQMSLDGWKAHTRETFGSGIKI
jgi:hypothetical protein|uniref:PX domain-containing protein n=1 Tax=Globisporangium ultimum (strain ATCC 200006 / CBS 805.95 / DAOM BR144) TaxID=431595 RepID=K3WRM5_GLOUD